ncbi:MAG: sugar transporter permease [Herbinix sp.]|nr:sugar transporter permease [Herbinix sp.]
MEAVASVGIKRKEWIQTLHFSSMSAFAAASFWKEGLLMKKGERKMKAAFILPIIVVYLIFFLYPTLRTLYMSFFETKTLSAAASTWKFVGFDNYKFLLNNDMFQAAYRNIMMILVIGGVAVFVIALFFATVMQGKFKGKKFFKAMIYLPNIITPIALAFMWTQYIFSNNFGLFKKMFTALGLESLANIPWTNQSTAFWAMLIAFCAAIDGAKKSHIFFRITLPLLKESTKTCLIFWSSGAINFFLWSRVFGANPLAESTLVPASYMYTLAFGAGHARGSGSLQVGPAAAIGVILTLSIVAVYLLVYLIFGNEKRKG